MIIHALVNIEATHSYIVRGEKRYASIRMSAGGSYDGFSADNVINYSRSSHPAEWESFCSRLMGLKLVTEIT